MTHTCIIGINQFTRSLPFTSFRKRQDIIWKNQQMVYSLLTYQVSCSDYKVDHKAATVHAGEMYVPCLIHTCRQYKSRQGSPPFTNFQTKFAWFSEVLLILAWYTVRAMSTSRTGTWSKLSVCLLGSKVFQGAKPIKSPWIKAFSYEVAFSLWSCLFILSCLFIMQLLLKYF